MVETHPSPLTNYVTKLHNVTINLNAPDMPQLPEGYFWRLSDIYGFDWKEDAYKLSIVKINKTRTWYGTTKTTTEHIIGGEVLENGDLKGYDSVQEYLKVAGETLLKNYSVIAKQDFEVQIVKDTFDWKMERF